MKLILSWRNRTWTELGSHLIPKENENWEELYHRLHREIFSSPTFALHRAAKLNCDRLIQRLILEENHPVDAEDDLYTPLGWAVLNNCREAARMLLRLQADPNLALTNIFLRRDPTLEMGALLVDHVQTINPDVFIQMAERGHLPAMKIILERGHGINSRNKRGETALNHLAGLTHRNMATLRWLLEQGADPNIPNHWGAYPVHGAMVRRDLKCFDLLAAFGANIWVVDQDGFGCLAYGFFGTTPDVISLQAREEIKHLKFILTFKCALLSLKIFVLLRRLGLR